MLPGPPSTQVSVDALMREIEADVRAALRNRIVARGGPSEYADDEIFAGVEAVLRRALERRDPELLLPALSDDEHQLVTHLRFSSHRPMVGPAVIFLKRRVLLPLMRWLYQVLPRELPPPGEDQLDALRVHRRTRDRERPAAARSPALGWPALTSSA